MAWGVDVTVDRDKELELAKTVVREAAEAAIDLQTGVAGTGKVAGFVGAFLGRIVSRLGRDFKVDAATQLLENIKGSADHANTSAERRAEIAAELLNDPQSEEVLLRGFWDRMGVLDPASHAPLALLVADYIFEKRSTDRFFRQCGAFFAASTAAEIGALQVILTEWLPKLDEEPPSDWEPNILFVVYPPELRGNYGNGRYVVLLIAQRTFSSLVHLLKSHALGASLAATANPSPDELSIRFTQEQLADLRRLRRYVEVANTETGTPG